MTVEEYAIDLICDGGVSTAEDDLNEDGAIADDDHEAACELAVDICKAIRENPGAVLALVGRTMRHATYNLVEPSTAGDSA